MIHLPKYTVRVFDENRPMPKEVEDLFRAELSDSRKPRSELPSARGRWEFRTICAVTDAAHTLGGVHLDIGPRNFGPLAADRVAFVEHVIVRREYRRCGVGITLLREAVEVARTEGCQCMRCNASWSNPAEIALFEGCGFALACIEDGEYFATKPLQGYACNE